MKRLGFIVPVFNSQETLEELHLRIKNLANERTDSYHIIFINDASTDGSWEKLLAIKKGDTFNVTIIKLARNYGQHNAILCGLQFCSTEFIITLDDDLQIPPEESSKLIDCILTQKYEVVYGIYSQKRHSLFRNFGSFVIQRIFSLVFDADGNISSFRIFTQNLKDRILKYKTSFTFIDGFIHWESRHVGRVEVDHRSRQYGRSGYSLIKLIALTINLIFNFTTLPLSLIILLGALCSSISFGLGLLFIIRKIMYSVPLGYTSIIVSMFLSTGLILMVIGIIGEYLRRLYISALNSPQYSIEQFID